MNPKTLMPFTHLDFFSDSTANFKKSNAGWYGWEYHLKQHLGADTFTNIENFVDISATLQVITNRLEERIKYWQGRRLDGTYRPVFVVMMSGNDLFGNKQKMVDFSTQQLRDLDLRAGTFANTIERLPGPCIIIGP